MRIVEEALGNPTRSEDPHVHGSRPKGALLAELQEFFLGLDKGYAFVGRRRHIRTELGDCGIDLVFYNYVLRRFVLVNLKTRGISPQDVSQMHSCVRAYDDQRRGEGDGQTIGIVVCAEAVDDIARNSVPINGRLDARMYELCLSDEDEPRAEVEARMGETGDSGGASS